MPAPYKNEFWKARSTHGRNPIFKDPEELWDACEQYFQWVHDNPLKTVELVKHQGTAKQYLVSKMRAMTVAGLCNYLDICEKTFWNYGHFNPDEEGIEPEELERRQGFLHVTTKVRSIIDQQKFEGAAAEQLNPNIIARDLGLTEKREFTGAGGSQLMPETITFVPYDGDEDDEAGGDDSGDPVH